MTGHRSAIPAVVVLFFLIFSPTINILLIDYAVGRALSQAFAGAFAILFMFRYRLTTHGTMFLAAMAVLAGLVLLATPFSDQQVITVRKIVGLVIVAMIIPKISDDHPVALGRFLVLTLLVTLIVVVLQLAGNADAVYSFVTYGNEGGTPVNLVELSEYLTEPIVTGYLPQLRPSGPFPAPTYLSLVLILLWYAIASAPNHRGRMAAAGVGALGILSGSSVGLFLAGMSLVFLPVKGRLLYTVIGAALTMWAYATLLPWQFSYNFNLEEFIFGFTTRLNLQQGGESIIQQRPYEFAAGIALAVVALLFARRLRLFTLARAALVIVFPVLLHDVGSSLLYWMLVALAVSSHTTIRFVAPALPRRPPQQTMPAAHLSPG